MPEPIHYFIVAALLTGMVGLAVMAFLTTLLPLFMFFTKDFKETPLESRVGRKSYDYDEDGF